MGELRARAVIPAYVIIQNKPIGSYKRHPLQKKKQELELSLNLAMSLRQKIKNKVFNYLTSTFTFSVHFETFKKSYLFAFHFLPPLLFPLCPLATYKLFD